MGAAATVLPTLGLGEPRKLDRFGGLKSRRFEASGYFRVHKADRWWLVTPEGSAFLSFGLNHAGPEYLLQPYNRDFWKKRFGAQDASETAFRAGFVKKVMKDLKRFGMNTLGCHPANKEPLGTLTVPYVQGLFFARTAYWIVRSAKDFPDVFSVEFEQHCEQIAQQRVLPNKSDPFLIGHTLTNVPILTDLDANAHGMVPWGQPQPDMPTWPRALRNMGGNHPGKQAFLSLVRERYPTVTEFNRVYRTGFSSFEELLRAENWSPTVKTVGIEDAKDNQAFLIRIYDRYYAVACKAIRKFDSNHLIFGDPLNANIGAPDDVVSLVAKHTDLIPYQYYGPYEEQVHILDRWSKLTGMPIFNTDSCFSVPYTEMPNPVGWHCPDQAACANRFLDLATRAFSRPDFIGWNWCGWVDSWVSWRKVQQHPGLQDPFGRYHHPMPATMAQCGSRIYDYGLGKTKGEMFQSS